MAANKPGKAEILAAFFDDGTYSPLFTDGAVSAAYGHLHRNRHLPSGKRPERLRRV